MNIRLAFTPGTKKTQIKQNISNLVKQGKSYNTALHLSFAKYNKK